MKPCIFIWFALISLPVRSQPKSGINVKVDKHSGKYTITSSVLHWTFSGTLGEPLKNSHIAHGHDEVGDYQAINFTWKSNNNEYAGSIRWYRRSRVVIFSLTLPNGAATSPMAFPDLTSFPDSLYHFSYSDGVFAPPQFKLSETSTPWLFFDRNKNAFVISPASDFIVAKLTGDGKNFIRSGLNPEVHNLPPGFTHATILVPDKGIQKTWDTWGHAMRELYRRQRPDCNDNHPILKYFGYWTDNGADYYYNYDTTRGYANTLLQLYKHYQQKNIPLGYMQLDSWWYEKSVYDENGKPGADPKNHYLPHGAWNRYGGLMEYKADSFLFPNGLAAFHHELALPLVTHNRWIDPHSPYHKEYKIYGYAATDQEFWNNIMDYLKQSGVFCYEQDWLNYIYSKSPDMIRNINVGNEFTDNMAGAAKSRGINMQYCMATPRFFMQGLKYNNLTTIRTSNDRFEPQKWRSFIYASQLAYEMGIWPWCDVFKSHETGNMIVSVLSAGVVGIGDALGKENKRNIMLACRNDGVLVKPDAPLLPVDEDYLHAACHEHKPVQAFTYTDHSGLITGYLFAFDNAQQDDRELSFRPAALGMSGEVVVFNPLTKQSRIMDAGDDFKDRLPDEKYAYYIIAPVTSSHIAFLGDTDKIAATGRQRIAAISNENGVLQIKVSFAKGEPFVTLRGFSVSPVTADKGDISYHPEMHLFTLKVPSEGNREVTVRIRVKND
jgi:hypothetical protein